MYKDKVLKTVLEYCSFKFQYLSVIYILKKFSINMENCTFLKIPLLNESETPNLRTF